MISLVEFDKWFQKAMPGDWITYHTGPHLFGLTGTKRDTANAALLFAEQGEIFICQRRVPGTTEFEYRAMRLDETNKKRFKAWNR